MSRCVGSAWETHAGRRNRTKNAETGKLASLSMVTTLPGLHIILSHYGSSIEHIQMHRSMQDWGSSFDSMARDRLRKEAHFRCTSPKTSTSTPTSTRENVRKRTHFASIPSTNHTLPSGCEIDSFDESVVRYANSTERQKSHRNAKVDHFCRAFDPHPHRIFPNTRRLRQECILETIRQ